MPWRRGQSLSLQKAMEGREGMRVPTKPESSGKDFPRQKPEFEEKAHPPVTALGCACGVLPLMTRPRWATRWTSGAPGQPHEREPVPCLCL